MAERKAFMVTYHMHPKENITTMILADTVDEAAIYAKSYRKDSFSIKEIKKEGDGHNGDC